jgi:hypothetical protein
MNKVRKLLPKRIGGLKVYEVVLVGGPADGLKSICSHNTVYMQGEKYVRGPDDRYYSEPKAGGPN